MGEGKGFQLIAVDGLQFLPEPRLGGINGRGLVEHDDNVDAAMRNRVVAFAATVEMIHNNPQLPSGHVFGAVVQIEVDGDAMGEFARPHAVDFLAVDVCPNPLVVQIALARHPMIVCAPDVFLAARNEIGGVQGAKDGAADPLVVLGLRLAIEGHFPTTVPFVFHSLTEPSMPCSSWWTTVGMVMFKTPEGFRPASPSETFVATGSWFS